MMAKADKIDVHLLKVQAELDENTVKWADISFNGLY